MNTQKFTQKSLEAISKAQQIALEHQNMQIEPEHLLFAFLEQQDGLIPRLFSKMDVDVDQALEIIEGYIRKIPGVSGPGREPDKVYVAQSVDKILIEAEKQAKDFRDEYVSAEHILLAFFEKPTNSIREIFRILRWTRISSCWP